MDINIKLYELTTSKIEEFIENKQKADVFYKYVKEKSKHDTGRVKIRTIAISCLNYTSELEMQDMCEEGESRIKKEHAIRVSAILYKIAKEFYELSE